MKNVWPIRTLGDLFHITSSKRVFEADWKRGGVPFYRAREIVKLAKHGFVENELFISEEMYKEYSSKYGSPVPGDIMVTGVGTLGICYVVKEADRFYFKDGNIIWLKKKTEADSRYVEYAFQSDFVREQIDDSVGTTVGTFTIVKAKGTRIPVPPVSEQQRIVRILDEAFDAIAIAKAKTEKNLQNTSALFESCLQSILMQRRTGWVEARLCELYSFKNGINFDKTQKNGHGILTIDVLNMYGASLDVNLSNLYRVNKDVSGEYILKNNDILVVRSSVKREGVGWAALFRETSEPVTFCGFIIRGRPIGPIDPEYAVYFLRCGLTREELIRRATQSTITNINQFNLGELIVPLPPLPEQRSIVSKLNSLRAETQQLESVYRRKLGALAELKKSLLHQAFTGQL